MSAKKLPTVAERHFALLCSEADDVTCNRSSDEDNAGWDFVIHLPPDPADCRPIDERSLVEPVFVQVKSTSARPFKVALKLSNALRMAKERNPFFVVLMVAGKSGRRFLARHFWSDEIAQTLKRVRQAESLGHQGQLHRKMLTLQLTDADDHTDDLLDWMATTIRAVRPDYQPEKARIAKTIGYSDSPATISVSLKGSPSEIIDWQLGLGATPAISRIKLTRERFGIVLSDPRIEEPGTRISIDPVGQDCIVSLRQMKGGPSIALAGKAYFAALPSLPGETRAWRIDLGVISLIGRGESCDCYLHPAIDERLSFQRLKDRITVAGWPGQGALSATFFLNGDRRHLSDVALPVSDESEEWQKMNLWLGTLQNIADGHPGQPVELSPGDLIDAGVWLERFHGLFSGTLCIQHPPNDDDDPTHAILYYLRCTVGAWSFVAIVRRDVAVDTIERDLRTLYLKPAHLLEAFVQRGRWQDHVEYARRSYDRHVQDMGDPTFFWDMGDMEDWIARATNPDHAATPPAGLTLPAGEHIRDDG